MTRSRKNKIIFLDSGFECAEPSMKVNLREAMYDLSRKRVLRLQRSHNPSSSACMFKCTRPNLPQAQSHSQAIIPRSIPRKKYMNMQDNKLFK